MDSPIIEVPDDPRLLRACWDFHRVNLGEHMFPRAEPEFENLAETRALWCAHDTHGIAGICYVRREDNKGSAEFGGIAIREDWAKAKRGLGNALGVVSISHHVIGDVFDALIAHVHIENTRPQRMLERLGFVPDKRFDDGFDKNELEQRLRIAIPMKADASGWVQGNGYRFEKQALLNFADQLLNDRLAGVKVVVVSQLLEGNGGVGPLAAELREIALSP